MAKHAYALLFSLSLVFNASGADLEGSSSISKNKIKETLQWCVKKAKEPFYTNVPGLHHLSIRLAALLGVEDLHDSFKGISDIKISESDALNGIYKFVVKTPIGYYAGKITKGGVIRLIAETFIADCCEKDSLSHWCANQLVGIPLDGKISLPGPCDVKLSFLDGNEKLSLPGVYKGIEISLDGDISCTNFVYNQCVKSQLPRITKEMAGDWEKTANVWLERYVKNLYKDILVWLKSNNVAITV